MQGVYALWILERQTGLCLFEQQFEAKEIKIDADLIGGFLNAITNFCEELVGEEMQILETNSKRLLYHGAHKFIIGVLLEKTVSIPAAEAMLTEISATFTQKYASYLQAGYVSNVAVFKDFAKEIEQRFEQKACFIHCYTEKQAKKKEQLENLLQYMKRMVEKRKCSM